MRQSLIDSQNQLQEKSIVGLLNLFMWEAEKIRLMTLEGDLTSTYATIRRHDDGTKTILADKLGSGYEAIQNVDLIQHVVSPMLDQGATIRAAQAFDGGRRVAITLDLAEQIEVKAPGAKRGDILAKQVMISNSHGADQTWRIVTIIRRLMCLNGATTSEESILSGRHCKNGLQNMIDAGAAFNAATMEFQAYGELMNRLASAKINKAQLNALIKRVHAPTYDKMEERATATLATKNEKEAFEKAQSALVKVQTEIANLFESEKSITEDPNAAGTFYGAYHALNFHENWAGAETIHRLQSLYFGAGRTRDLAAMNAARELVLV